MKLTKHKGKGNILEVEVADTPDWYVNTVRRLLLTEVPVMAIETVEISKNDSVLYDEIVAHRLGLVPLTTDIKGYVMPGKEEVDSQEYLAQSSCKLTLEAKGPGVVYARDFVSNDPKVKPVYPDMPITKLLEGQELRLIATAVLGNGRAHAKWSAGHSFFKRIPKSGAKTTHENSKDIATDASETDYLLRVEAWGQVPPAEMVEASLEAYTKQLKEFDTLLGSVQ